MKLLFDQNLSYRLAKNFQIPFNNSSHVRFHNLQEVDDLVIFEFAKKNNFTIVTQDSDLYDLALVKGIPPKIIWVRTGNSSTAHIEKLLRENIMVIERFISVDNKICLELF